MWRSKREFVCLVLVAIFTIATLVSAVSVKETENNNRECAMHDLDTEGCKPPMTCTPNKITGKSTCVCQPGYVRDITGENCIDRPTTFRPPLTETTTEKLDDTHRSSGSSVAVGLLVPTFLIGLGALGFCIARRYRLLPCRRNLYGNVLVTRDDDDDDPPIA